MKVSEIDYKLVSQYLNLYDDEDEPDITLRLEIESYIAASKSYALEYSGLPIEVLDTKEYMVFPVLLLIADMYENKSMEGFRAANKTFSSFMALSKEVNL